jgi:hypothetical protein
MAEEHQNADRPEFDPSTDPQNQEQPAQDPQLQGNRPAENANVMPPSRQFDDMWATEGLEATDFLGLNAEIQQPLGYGDALDPPSIQPATGGAPAESWMLDPAEDQLPGPALDPAAPAAQGEDGNWLLDGEHAGAPGAAYSDTTEYDENGRPIGSYVDPDTKQPGASRFLVPMLAAAGIVSVLGVMWKVVTTTGLSGDPDATVAVNTSGLGPVELLNTGDGGSSDTRRGVHRDGTVDPLVVNPVVPTGVAGGADPAPLTTAAVDPVATDPTPPVEPPRSPEELEALAVLESFAAHDAGSPPD